MLTDLCCQADLPSMIPVRLICSGQLQLVERFQAGLHLQQCFEPGASEAQYRRALALRLTASDDVVVHASRFAASQLQGIAALLGAARGTPPPPSADVGAGTPHHHHVPIQQASPAPTIQFFQPCQCLF